MKRLLLLLGCAVALFTPDAFAQSAPAPHAAVGSWAWPGGARRVLRADRVVEVYDARGAAEPSARYLLIDPATVDIKYADGHFARCRLRADGSMEVTARRLTGEVQTFRARREGTAEPEPPPRPAAARPDPSVPHAVVGTWVFKPDVYASRVFEPDGRCRYRGADGQTAKEARYRVVDVRQVEVVAADGWTDVFRLQPDGVLELEAKRNGVTEVRTRGRRQAAIAVPRPEPAPADSPMPGLWHHLGDSRKEPVVVLADGTLFSIMAEGLWTYAPASRQLTVTWDQSPARVFLLSADGERVVQTDGTNQWRRWTEPVQRLRNRTTLPAAAALTNLVVGDWCRQPDAANGLYVYQPDGRVVKYENAARDRVANRGRYYLFRDDALMVVRWQDEWRDYLPLPPGRRDWTGWNNRGTEIVRLPHRGR